MCTLNCCLVYNVILHIMQKNVLWTGDIAGKEKKNIVSLVPLFFKEMDIFM